MRDKIVEAKPRRLKYASNNFLERPKSVASIPEHVQPTKANKNAFNKDTKEKEEERRLTKSNSSSLKALDNEDNLKTKGEELQRRSMKILKECSVKSLLEVGNLYQLSTTLSLEPVSIVHYTRPGSNIKRPK